MNRSKNSNRGSSRARNWAIENSAADNAKNHCFTEIRCLGPLLLVFKVDLHHLQLFELILRYRSQSWAVLSQQQDHLSKVVLMDTDEASSVVLVEEDVDEVGETGFVFVVVGSLDIYGDEATAIALATQ